jgi:hypothetical protein
MKGRAAPKKSPPKRPTPEAEMKIGQTYNVVFLTGKYDIGYENGVKCVKITPKSYRAERPDGTTRLVGQDSIVELKRV